MSDTRTAAQRDADQLERYAAQFRAERIAEERKADGNAWQDEPAVRHPLLRARVGEGQGGKIIRDLIAANITSNTHYQADRFSATFRLVPDAGYGMRWWGDQTKLLLTIEAGFGRPGAEPDWRVLHIGEVDQLTADPASGVVECDGRDLSARLIDAKTQETFLNETSSQVATILAQRHGLTPRVTPTKTLVSRFYQDDHTAVTGGEFRRTTTEWDLLAFLAQNEGYDLYVVGTELHFHPSDQGGTLYQARWDGSGEFPISNVMGLQLERSLTLAKQGVVVAVRSWHGRKGRGFTKLSPSNANLQRGNAQRVSITRPDLTEDQAQKLADSIRADIIKNERLLRFSRPADLVFTARDRVQMRGTDSSWDQMYWVSEITRRLSVEGGFLMNVSCKNHSPESDAAPL